MRVPAFIPWSASHQIGRTMEVVLREKGRITLPASVRRALGLREGDRLTVSVERGAIVLKPKAVVVDDVERMIGPMEVKLEEVEEALGKDEIR